MDDIFYAAAGMGLQEEARLALEQVMEINYYLPGMDVCGYIESRKIEYLRPVLEKWKEHSEPNVRRWIQRALAAII